MAVLIDTSLLVEYERGRDQLGPLVAAEEAAISVITVSELLHGAHRADPPRHAQRLAWVEHVLGRFVALPVTEDVARVHAGVWAALEATGSLIGAHDLWIAATALQHRLGVATLNGRDFTRVAELRVVSP